MKNEHFEKNKSLNPIGWSKKLLECSNYVIKTNDKNYFELKLTTNKNKSLDAVREKNKSVKESLSKMTNKNEVE